MFVQVGIEPYIIRAGDGFPSGTTVEDGVKILTRTGATSIVCMGSVGPQEAAKSMAVLHRLGGTTLERGITRAQQQSKAQVTNLPIVFVPTDLAPPAWSRPTATIFHPTIPGLIDLPCGPSEVR